MSGFLRATILLLLLASCGGGNFKAPRNLDDACAIVKERPEYLRALERTEKRWGVPVGVQMAIIYQESKFIGNARTPVQYVMGVIPMGRQSSAYGYAQALDATWAEYKRSEGGMGADRDDIRDATDFIGWYLVETEKAIGVSRTDARNQYLAYHEGRTGYLKGTYKSKGWLMSIANDVGARAQMYTRQLANCRNSRWF